MSTERPDSNIRLAPTRHVFCSYPFWFALIILKPDLFREPTATASVPIGGISASIQGADTAEEVRTLGIKSEWEEGGRCLRAAGLMGTFLSSGGERVAVLMLLCSADPPRL